MRETPPQLQSATPVRALTAVNLTGWSLERGVRGAIACALPLLGAEWYHQPTLSWAALIGFWVVLVDPGWPTRTRLAAISTFITLSATGCFVAVLLRPYPAAAGVFALLWCFGAILIRVWGDSAGTAGNLAAIAVVIALGAERPASLAAAGTLAAVTIGGGLWGLALVFCVGRQRADQPMRQALATVFRVEAAHLRELADAQDAPQLPRGAIRDAIEKARAGLVASRGHWFGSKAGVQRFMLLLGDGNGVLGALLALREMLQDAPEAGTLSPALFALAVRLDAIAAVIADGRAVTGPPRQSPLLPASDNISAALQQITNWIEAAEDHLTNVAPGLGPSAVPRTVPNAGPLVSPAVTLIPDEPAGWLDQLRTNLTFASLSFRHAARFAVTAAGLTLLTKSLHLDMGYWITLTAVIILQAYPSATWQRAIQRVGGTLLGGAIASAATLILHGPIAVTLVVVPLGLLAMAARAVSYAIYIVCITPMFILMTELFSHGGVLSPDLAGLRMIDNVIGAGLGMVATFALWPSWESRYLRRRLADGLRDNGHFVLTALDAWMGTATESQAEIARRRAGLSVNNAEASIRRALDEPRRYPPKEIAAAMAIASVSRRLSGIAAALMQCPRQEVATETLTDTRQYLQAQIETMTAAIEQRGAPPSTVSPPSMVQDGGEIRSLLVRATRQLVVASEAAYGLATERNAAADSRRSA